MRRQNGEMSELSESKVMPGTCDDRLSAKIIARRTLLYELGADRALDRPAHVRAASGVNWFGDRLAIVQDDASFLALVDPHGASVQAITLPGTKQGIRQFDAVRGNKLDKPDFEACFSIEDVLFALGSGSHSQRERVALISPCHEGFRVRERWASELYRALRSRRDFAGSELNLEGALVLGEHVRLFQRGNGAAHGHLLPVNATCDLSRELLFRYLTEASSEVPPIERVVRYELGRIAGVPLTFTDVAFHPVHGVLFLACAEASPDTLRDGDVMGTAVGTFDEAGAAHWGLLLDEHGEPSRDKAEGIVVDKLDPERAFVVVDPDDHTRPAQLLTVSLSL
jgi:hypothetical protein